VIGVAMRLQKGTKIMKNSINKLSYALRSVDDIKSLLNKRNSIVEENKEINLECPGFARDCINLNVKSYTIGTYALDVENADDLHQAFLTLGSPDYFIGYDGDINEYDLRSYIKNAVKTLESVEEMMLYLSPKPTTLQYDVNGNLIDQYRLEYDKSVFVRHYLEDVADYTKNTDYSIEWRMLSMAVCMALNTTCIRYLQWSKDHGCHACNLANDYMSHCFLIPLFDVDNCGNVINGVNPFITILIEELDKLCELYNIIPSRSVKAVRSLMKEEK
jgi:hypothetical protein